MTIGNDDRIRTFLADEARRAVAAGPSLDEAVGRLAPRIGGRPSGASQRLIVLLAATLLLVAALGTAIAVGSGILRLPLIIDDPETEPMPELGIFEPVAGRIVSGVFAVDPAAVDPSAPSRSTPLRMGPEEVRAVGWSSDGTELLFMRKDPTPTVPFATVLFILHADGTETPLTDDGMEMWGATIAPDGSRVVYAARDVDAARSVPPSLFAVDAKGGQPIRIAEEGEQPTFSPDGSQIAYAVNKTGEGHVWVADADGSDAHEILANESTLVRGVDELAWSPTGDRIAMGDQGEGHVAIYTFAPDGSDFTKVITGGINAFWSPDGSQIAYLRPYDGPRPGLAIADADGSNVREFGFGASGPWHPGTLVDRVGAPRPSPSSGFSRFDSTIHAISIDHPSDWQVRPATEPWDHDAFTFDAPGVDVIFDPTLQDDLYLSLASWPVAGQSAEDWCCSELWAAAAVCETGGNFGRITVDGARATIRACDGIGANRFEDHVIQVATATHGYVIYLHVKDDPILQATYTEDWFDVALDTVELR